MTRILKISICAAVVYACPILADAQLLGSQVSVGVYCCTAPVPADLVSNIATAIVSNNVEFPLGSLVGSSLIPTAIDVGADFIDISYTSNAVAASGTFNGYAFTFTGAPTITSVSVDSSSTVRPISVNFNGNTIDVNLAGVASQAGEVVALDISTAGVTSVPEPSSITLILGAAAMYIAWARRRRVGNR